MSPMMRNPSIFNNRIDDHIGIGRYMNYETGSVSPTPTTGFRRRNDLNSSSSNRVARFQYFLAIDRNFGGKIVERWLEPWGVNVSGGTAGGIMYLAEMMIGKS